MFNKTDIIFIIIFIIIVTLLVGINISNLIDKKISDISVNLPKINIPKPQITLNITTDNKEKFIVCTETNNNKSPNKTEDDHNCNINQNGDNVEKFTVPDAQNIYYDKIKKQFMKEYNDVDFSDQEGNMECTKSNDPRIVYPKTDMYEKSCANKWQKFYSCKKKIYPGKNTYKSPATGKTYVSEYDYGLDAPPYYVSCSNGASTNLQKKKKIKNVVAKHIPCNQPNLLTSENYWRSHTKHSVPIVDYYIKGYNYSNYQTASSPYTIDKQILSQATKGLPESSMRVKNLPHGYNYVFQHHVPVRGNA